MRAARSLVLVALLPVFAGCQLLNSKPVDSNAGLTRLQGELVSDNGQLVFQPCVGQQRYVVSDGASTTLVQDATDMPVKPGKLFADIRGSFVSAKTPGEQGEVKLQQVYRLERSSAACQDPNFKQQTVHANGNGPAWEVQAGGKGLILKREGQQDLALPYVEEQIGDSRFSLSTEAKISVLSSGSPRSAAPTASTAACNTWRLNCGSMARFNAVAVILVARVTTNRQL